jgi:hypothetical protein
VSTLLATEARTVRTTFAASSKSTFHFTAPATFLVGIVSSVVSFELPDEMTVMVYGAVP